MHVSRRRALVYRKERMLRPTARTDVDRPSNIHVLSAGTDPAPYIFSLTIVRRQRCIPPSSPAVYCCCPRFTSSGSNTNDTIFAQKPVDLSSFFCPQLDEHYAEDHTYGIVRDYMKCLGHPQSTFRLHSDYPTHIRFTTEAVG